MNFQIPSSVIAPCFTRDAVDLETLVSHQDASERENLSYAPSLGMLGVPKQSPSQQSS